MSEKVKTNYLISELEKVINERNELISKQYSNVVRFMNGQSDLK